MIDDREAVYKGGREGGGRGRRSSLGGWDKPHHFVSHDATLGDLEEEGGTHQGGVGLGVDDHLKAGEVLQHSIHLGDVVQALELKKKKKRKKKKTATKQTQSTGSTRKRKALTRKIGYLVNKLDHVVAHGRVVEVVRVGVVLQNGVLHLDLLHHRLAKGVHSGGALQGHSLSRLVLDKEGMKTIVMLTVGIYLI